MEDHLRQGVQFTLKFWWEFLRMIGSFQGLSYIFHLATNGVVERANAIIEQYIRCYVNYQQTYWADLIPFAEVAYNTVHSSTGFTLFKMANGIEFVPIPEYPWESPSSISLTEWVGNRQRVW